VSFKAATKKQLKLRMGIVAPAGAGKTYTALAVARGLVGPEGRIALIDTEHRSAEKYADLFTFDVDYLSDDCAPARYVEKIHDAAKAGYDCLIIDSLTHAWAGPGGALEMVDNAARMAKGNSYVAWRNVTPEHNRLVAAMLSTPMHLIATLRAKTEYVLETVGGKQVPRKVGMAPIQREGMDYEFDVVADMDHDHALLITKTRCAAVDGKTWIKPGGDGELVEKLRVWLDGGERVEVEPEVPVEQNAGEKSLDDAAARKNMISEISSAKRTLGWDKKGMDAFVKMTIGSGKTCDTATDADLNTMVQAMAAQIESKERGVMDFNATIGKPKTKQESKA